MSKEKVLDSWKKLKKNVDSFVKENNIKELQKSVVKMLQTAQKDLSSVVDKDFSTLKQKFKKETAQFEKMIDSIMAKEIEKAKKFVSSQKEELLKLQDKLEKLVIKPKKKAPAKKAAKKVAKKKVTKKKTTKE